jgi:hypothetical protein
MTTDKQLITGGQLQARTGAECTADAGVCALSGTHLYRRCLTPHVARLDRYDRGQYDVVGADGRHAGFVEAPDRRQALLRWYVERVDSLQAELAQARELYAESIEVAAIRLVRNAMANGGQVQIGPSIGDGCRALPGGGQVRTHDLYRYCDMLGLHCQVPSCIPGTMRVAQRAEDLPIEE